jgi:catechol 2,3-dioxygenase-like lactoylglutathione lyase family enzyme
MLADSDANHSFAVDDTDAARSFYADTLGVEVSVMDEENHLLQLHLKGNRPTLIYQKPDFAPAGYTVLNFTVEDIDAAVDDLTRRGVRFERYDGFEQDEKGVARGGPGGAGGPQIAWFKDPAGNILSVVQT